MIKKKTYKKNKGSVTRLLSVTAVVALLIFVYLFQSGKLLNPDTYIDGLGDSSLSDQTISIDEIPEYSSEPYIEINGNVPGFSDEELTTESYERYSDLDELGRCGVAEACIGTDLMPTGERQRISSIRPSGWNTAHYDFVDQGMLFNRSHLIAYQLAGEELNEKNLITGTRFLNASTMLPFEEQVGNWVRKTRNHVMYRVTPVFYGDELVARGVHMEALSVEDGGKAISYNVFIYNVQPGVDIDYSTGNNWPAESSGQTEQESADSEETGETDSKAKSYVLNTRSKKFHDISCPNIADISENNKKEVKADRKLLIENGFDPCGYCNP